MRIWHDPGHGGRNHGVRYGQLYENDIVLDLAQGYTARQRSQDDIEFALSRQGDESGSYAQRAQSAKNWGTDLALLHHVNAIYHGEGHACAGQANSNERGVAVFIIAEENEPQELSYALGREFLLALPHPLRLWKDRTTPYRSRQTGKDGKPHWTNRARYHLIHYVCRGLPAILIEWGFATNDFDRRLLLDRTRRELFYRPLDAMIQKMIELKETICKS